MADYLLIASRDPFEAATVPTYYDLASGLRRAGHGVCVFLLQNGVLPARPCRHSDRIQALLAEGVSVLAEELSLRERGIDPERLVQGVKAAPLAHVVDRLEAGDKVVWN